MRSPLLALLLLLLAGSLGFAGYVSRTERYPLKDVVVPVTGKQYRLYSDSSFTVFVAYGPDRETWQREAAGLAPYLAERADRTGDTVATVLALHPGFARILPTREAAWYRFGIRDGSWQMIGEAAHRADLTPAR